MCENDTTKTAKMFELPKSKDEVHVLVSSDVLLSGKKIKHHFLIFFLFFIVFFFVKKKELIFNYKRK